MSKPERIWTDPDLIATWRDVPGTKGVGPYIHIDTAAPEALIERVAFYMDASNPIQEMVPPKVYDLLTDLREHFAALREGK